MNMKRFLALLLALAMVLALAGCAANNTIEAYTDDDLVTDETSAEDTSEGIDLQAGFETYPADQTIFYVNNYPVTWQELYYEIVYYANYLAQQEETTLTDWNQACTLFTDDDGNYYSYGVVVLSNAVSILVQYYAMYSKLVELGITGDSEDVQNYVETTRQNVIDESFDGDDSAFADYLSSMYCTQEIWDWFNMVDGMYAYDGFDTLYGEFGSDYSDEDTLTYAEGDENGTWTQYVDLRLIEISNDDASDEASGEMTAEEIADELNDSYDKTSTYEELYAQYNEYSDLDPYIDGWCVYEGDVDDAVYQAALEMQVGEAKAVASGDKDYVILKTEITPDAGVYYDTTDGTMYTLRYYAAWQDYSDTINGEDGWINSAETEWAEGYENFSIASIFPE